MTNRTCLRCDWHGEADAKKCPACGEPLYELVKPPSEGAGAPARGHPEERSREAASTGIVAPSAAPPRPSSPPPHPPAEATPQTPVQRSRSLVAMVLTVVVLAVALGSWLDAHREPPKKAAAQRVTPIGLTGTLVYAVPDGVGVSRLWRWDLATGRAVRGPRVPRAIQLVDARGANDGWIGVTSALGDGRLQASVLRFLGPDDRPTPILEGDLVSWGPQGATVAAGRRGPLRPGCRPLGLDRRAKLVPALRERRYEDPSLCGDLLSIGLDDASTMFTLDRGGRIGIFFAGGTVRTIHRVLAGYAMVDLGAVRHHRRPAGVARQPDAAPTRPDQEHADLEGAALHFLSGPARPLPYGVPHEPFAVARMLAWNANAGLALVVGREAFRRGFYLLDTASGDGVDAPRYIGPSSGIPYGTFALDDTVFVETAEGLFAGIGSDLVRLQPPADAPAPEGPIVSIPLAVGSVRLGILAAMNVSVVGAGRVGTAMAVLLGRAGHRIVAVAGRGPTRDRASRFLSDVPFLDPRTRRAPASSSSSVFPTTTSPRSRNGSPERGGSVPGSGWPTCRGHRVSTSSRPRERAVPGRSRSIRCRRSPTSPAPSNESPGAPWPSPPRTTRATPLESASPTTS